MKDPVGKRRSSPTTDDSKLPVVGIGASAGGLAALKALFGALPESCPLAFVVIVHMSADQPSALPEILGRSTSLPVVAATDGTLLAAGHIYVRSPNDEVTMVRGKLQIRQLSATTDTQPGHVIDRFFRSLSTDQGESAAAVVLSGTGADGTLGSKAIHEGGGVVVAQSMESAQFPSMPQSVVATGATDAELPPGEIPLWLTDYFANAGSRSAYRAGDSESPGGWLEAVFDTVLRQTGHNFAAYKESTLLRRIDRRMNLNGIKKEADYPSFLQENPAEVEALFRELLIGVTSFFRDVDSFAALAEVALPGVLASIPVHSDFRVWVPGCSTGEEAYSIAIAIVEAFEAHARPVALQIFATDIDPQAIARARAGVYPATIAADIRPDRLDRFFGLEGDHYRVRNTIRDRIVFSIQDILRDPPISRLNLLCCRNLLIYLNSAAQKRILPLFHHTLLPGGILMLGGAESVGKFGELFEPVSKKWSIYRRKETPMSFRNAVQYPAGALHQPSVTDQSQSANTTADLGEITRNLILQSYAPAAVLVDGAGEILYVHGRTGRYLESPSGAPTKSVIDVAREGIRIELAAALRAARSSNAKQIRPEIRVSTDTGHQTINLHILPLQDRPGSPGNMLVLFEDVAADITGESDDQDRPAQWSAGLDHELQITRRSHARALEEVETTNAELKATNAELQSTNEELQSTNEELESSKEELQSMNEELQTLNTELESKLDELSAAHDDMRNLLNSADIATVFVDIHANVRRYTPDATRIVNLIPTDVGRPFSHLVTNLKTVDLEAQLQHVLDTLEPARGEVQTTDGGWYNMSIVPYRTIDNRIDGAVLTFASIREQKQTQSDLETSERDSVSARQLLEKIFVASSVPAVLVDELGTLVLVNTAFESMVGKSSSDLQGKQLAAAVDVFRNARLEERISQILRDGLPFVTAPLELDLDDQEGDTTVYGELVRTGADGPAVVVLRFLTGRQNES